MYVAPCGENFESIREKLDHFIKCKFCKEKLTKRNKEPEGALATLETQEA